MEATTQAKHTRDNLHIARMVMTPQGWMPGGSCWCGAAGRDHLRQSAPGRWRCTKCNTRYHQRGDTDGLFLMSTTETDR